jgi:hypothetical protein
MWRPGDRLDRVENAVISGQPDVNGCLQGEDVWVELKAPTEPKRAATPLMTSNGNHPLLQTQINWMARQQQAGGIAFILIRTDKRMLLVDGTKYATGHHFNRYTVEQMERIALFRCDVPTKQEDWRLLRNVIFTASRHRRLHHHASAQQLLADLERGEKDLAGDRDARRRSAVAPGGVPPGGARGRRRGAGEGA